MRRTISIHTSSVYLLILTIVWFIIPYPSIILLLFFLNQQRVTLNELKYTVFLISLTFGLLSFTQESINNPTDVVRYYEVYYPFISRGGNILGVILEEPILTYSFTFINIIISSITRNVQYISLFWTTFIYYLYFLSIINYFSVARIALTKSNTFLVIFFSIFGVILFTQVTETVKTAAAFSLFFYIFSIYLIDDKFGLKLLLLLILDFGIHAMVLFLVPLFFYKRFKSGTLLTVLILVVAICSQLNIMQIASNILPDYGLLGVLKLKSEHYSLDDGFFSKSITYNFVAVIILLVGIFLYIKNIFNKKNCYLNIVLIYLIIMYLNFNNSNGFVRFANFASFIIALEFIPLLKNLSRNNIILLLLFVYFFAHNLHITYVRTLVPGGYCSSYMDNSISRILLSSSIEYLSFIAYP